jgi:hypothetical protein
MDAFIIRNSSMFVKAKRTIFHHNYENATGSRQFSVLCR